MRLTITDHSRPIAADRWYVRIVAVIALPLPASMFAGIHEEQAGEAAAIRRLMGERLERQLVKERNFVDEREREDLVAKLVEQLAITVGGYLEHRDFPARFFATGYREAREHWRREASRSAPADAADDEPADFSHCFR